MRTEAAEQRQQAMQQDPRAATVSQSLRDIAAIQDSLQSNSVAMAAHARVNQSASVTASDTFARDHAAYKQLRSAVQSTSEQLQQARPQSSSQAKQPGTAGAQESSSPSAGHPQQNQSTSSASATSAPGLYQPKFTKKSLVERGG